MKRILSMCLSIVMVFSMLTVVAPLTASAWGETEQTCGNYTYIVKNNEAYLTGYKGSATSVTIPATLDGYKVVYLGENIGLGEPLKGFSKVTSLTIGNNVKCIGTRAFINNTNLKSLNVEDGVVEICDQAFESCTSLSSIKLADSVVMVSSAFNRTKWYEKQSSGLVYIGKVLYGYKGNIPKNYTLNVKSGTLGIGNAFDNYDSKLNIVKVSVPNTVEYVSNWAFNNTTWYNNQSNGMVYVGKCAYKYKGKIPASVTIKKGTKSISIQAFYDGHACYYGYTGQQSSDNYEKNSANLKSISIPDGLKYIGSGAFANCCNLNTITIPDSIEYLGKYFYGFGAAYKGDLVKMKEYSFTLKSYKNSPAYRYAQLNGINFVRNLYFEIKSDTNQFTHSGLPHRIDNEKFKTQLFKDATSFNMKSNLYNNLDGKTGGVCHGLALSMCYGNQGYIDFNKIVPHTDCYWELGTPYNNRNFSDIIMYYHMTQNTNKGQPTKTLSKDGWSIIPLSNRTESFFKSLVNEAKTAKNQKRPFVFTFFYKRSSNSKEEGHSVVVCGYNWNSSKNRHEIKIYDENSYVKDSNPVAKYTTLSIASDYKSFSFADANAEALGYKIENVWTSLSYYGLNKLYNDISIGTLSDQSTAKPVVVSDNEVSANNRATIQLSSYKKFRLTNSEGKELVYDGKSYSGTMKVYDCQLFNDGNNSYWIITTDDSTMFKVTDISGSFSIVYSGSKIPNVGVSTEKATNIYINKNGVKAYGNKFDASVAMDTKKCDFVKIHSEKNEGSLNVAKTKTDSIILSSKNNAQNISVDSYKGANSVDKALYKSLDSNLTVNSEGKSLGKNPDSVKLNKTTATLFKGNKLTLSKTVTPANSNQICTWSSSNTKIATVSDGVVTAKAAGTATITVKTSNGKTATCKVTVTSTLPAPSISSLTNTTGGIKLAWKKIDGAYGYRVYQKTSSGWSRIKDTTATSYTDSAVSANQTKTYTIRCIDKNGKTISGYNSKGWSKKYTPVAPTISKLENTTGGVKLSWNKITGVYGYRVYAKTSSGWKKLKDTTATSLTDSAVTANKTKTYTIRCIDKKGKTISGYNSKGWSKKYTAATPKITKLKNTSKGVSVTWNKVAGVYGYRLYRKYAGGSWTKVKDTTSTSFTDSGAKKGKKVTYTVRCIDKKGNTVSNYNKTGWSITRK
ncbi:leucine-rich repeat protein [Ruminococcus bromii]|uniref:leucine-rich repeat protein n=1 Tax=Ruminococcus bromii TaxID=40518 RepID=UPI0026ECAAE2|nr:leucine-rich repeat protein [Ruminococcus bromii]